MSNKQEGGVCGRGGCPGVIAVAAVENCSCHIAPPCGACIEPREYCPECGWRLKDEPSLAAESLANYVWDAWNQRADRKLDSTKIDYVIRKHSASSQICEGVYPPTATPADVRKMVDGTFGGRFEHFGDGRFKFIAYTD